MARLYIPKPDRTPLDWSAMARDVANNLASLAALAMFGAFILGCAVCLQAG